MNDKTVCHTCKKYTNELKCSKCKVTIYCSKECQRFDWKEHKKICYAIDDPDKIKENLNKILLSPNFKCTLSALVYLWDKENNFSGYTQLNIDKMLNNHENLYKCELFYESDKDVDQPAGLVNIHHIKITFCDSNGDGIGLNVALQNDICKECYNIAEHLLTDIGKKVKLLVSDISENYMKIEINNF